jgi:zinc protease
VSEILWATAFDRHAYKWPTIGWMKDIEGFTTDDCAAFYRTYYAPNNATIIVVGDYSESALLEKISQAYGHIGPSTLPVEDYQAEPPQTAERRREVKKPTPTEKLAIGYHAPALGDYDHLALSLLVDVLFGGRASRVHQRLVRQKELAADVRASVGPFRDPGLFEIYASAREGHRAEELLTELDAELRLACEQPVTNEELERARARTELGLLSGLETAEGKASTIGFYETVLGRPAAAFERLEAVRRLGPSDLIRAARRYFNASARSVVLVRAELGAASDKAAE